MDDAAHAALPPHLVSGNRFGSYGFGAGLSGLLLALAPFGHALAWLLALTAVALGLKGFVRYGRGAATNRDTSVVALVLGWIGLVTLIISASVALNPLLAAYSSAP